MADDTLEIMADDNKKQRIPEIQKNRLKKLAIWDTRTFNPIIHHADLERIMATLGFVAVPYFPPTPPGGSSPIAAAPGTTWKEYTYPAGVCYQWLCEMDLPPPLPRLPYPRIDGLHISSYRVFLDAVNFYLEMGDDLSNIFHVRYIPFFLSFFKKYPFQFVHFSVHFHVCISLIRIFQFFLLLFASGYS